MNKNQSDETEPAAAVACTDLFGPNKRKPLLRLRVAMVSKHDFRHWEDAWGDHPKRELGEFRSMRVVMSNVCFSNAMKAAGDSAHNMPVNPVLRLTYGYN